MGGQNGFLDQECGLPNGGFGDQKQMQKEVAEKNFGDRFVGILVARRIPGLLSGQAKKGHPRTGGLPV